MLQTALTQGDQESDPLSPQPRRNRLGGAVGLAGVLLGYGVLRLYGFHLSLSDENIYYYMARATAERGLLPYRDYFFAHPPVHLVPLIIAARLFPHSYSALQAVPMIAGAIAAIFLFLLAYRTWGALAATLTAGLFLFSLQVLSGTSHDTGVDIAVALVAIALYFALIDRELWGGILFGLAALAGVYALAGAVAIALVLALGGWRQLRPFLIALASTLAGGNLVGWAIGGSAYWHDVYVFAMRIPGGRFGFPFGDTLMLVTVFNFTIMWAAVMGVGLWIWDAVWLRAARRREALARSRRRRRREAEVEQGPWWRALSEEPSHRVMAGALAYVLATFLFFSTRGNLAQYYFMLPFPGLALLGGRGAGQFIATLCAAFPARRQEADARVPALRPTLVVMGALLVAGAGVRLGLGATATVRSRVAAPKSYVWSDAPLIGPLNDVVRALFWRETGKPGRVYGTVQEYLWRRSYHFDTAREIADHVRRHTGPDDTIFGDMLIAPLVALLADRRLAGDIADTSEVRFESGIYTVEECWQEIDRERAAYIILPQQVSLADFPEFRRRLVDGYGREPEREFHDSAYGTIGVFRRKPVPTAPRSDR